MISKFYLDKEKDIIVNLYRTKEDEITYIFNNNTKTEPFVVVFIRETENGKYYEGIESCGNRWVTGGVKYQKTGRHFPEVAELLKKMRGNEEE